MAEETLRLVVRTPQGAVFDERVSSMRLPSDTGQVGLRPRSETAAFVVEPGLLLAVVATRRQFIATAGGLLRCDGHEAVLLTPLAVVGESAELVRAELAALLSIPQADLEFRDVLQRLETGILQEVRRETSVSGRGQQFG